MTATMSSAAASTTGTLPSSSSVLPSVPENLPLVRVAFDYEYEYKTRTISVKQGEKLYLIEKTNQHWWKCLRQGVNKAFFVPAQYVIVLDEDGDAKKDEDKEKKKKSSSSSVDSSDVVAAKPRKSIFRLKDSSKSKVAVPSKPNKSNNISSRNEGSRASHRVVTEKEKNHHERKSSSSLRLKNWSSSLEELSKQIVFPGLTSSVVDLTSLSANNSFKPIASTKKAPGPLPSPPYNHPTNENNASGGGDAGGRQGSSGGSSGSCDGKLHTINKCLSFRNPTFANNNNNDNNDKEKQSPANEHKDKNTSTSSTKSLDSPAFNLVDSLQKSKEGSEASLDSATMKDGSVNIPVPKGPPLRVLGDNWMEYYSKERGRYFYYNSEEKKTSWKPPRSSSNRRSDEGRSGASTNSLDNLSEEMQEQEDLPNQIPSSLGSSRRSVSNLSTEEISGTPEKIHHNHGSSSSVFDSQENLDDPHNHHQQEEVEPEVPVEYSFDHLTSSIHVPPEWEQCCWEQQLCFVNKINGAKWFTSTDPQGKIYFYDENGSQSSWFLPVSSTSGETKDSPSSPKDFPDQAEVSNSPSNSEEAVNSGTGTVKKRHSAGDALTDRGTKSKSLFLPDFRSPVDTLSRFPNSNSLPRQPNASIWHPGHANNIIREGQLGRTKITESGKKVRKNWGSVFAVLTDAHLSLFKDQKSFTAHKSEVEIELNGSTVEWTEEKSSRKNVFQLNTRTDHQMLFQSEDKANALEWFEDIKRISESYLPVDISMRLRSTETETLLDPPIGERKFSSRLYRNKSTKLKITPADDTGDRKRITSNLKKFFSRRPTRDSLAKKGIYKDEPVFGCSLEQLCKIEKTTVPLFVQECILAIEEKEENLKTDGLYRASGNLSLVQKIRLQVDQNNFQCLYQEDDVHVLAGSLKLFFREMREPLISYDLFERSFDAINSNKKDKVAKFRDIVKSLAKPNRDTLQALLRHLLKVAEFAEFNRMMVPNLAIVFGPTLMWPQIESKNMALDLMQQNYVIEALLVDFESIFQ